MPGGRPPKYNKNLHPALARAHALRGVTDEEMADELGIVRSTYYKWKKDHPEFSDAIKAGKDRPDDLVEAALFKRAVGFRHPDEKIFLNKFGEIVRAETVKHYPPDPTSMIFYLKNRRPEKWRDKQEIEHKNPDGPIVTFYIPDNGRGPSNDSSPSD